MMTKFERCHEITARWEGGWSDNPKDRGGKTMYGITQATLTAYLGRPASDAEIRSLDKATARAIYKRNYWDRVSGDALPAGLDLCIYDWGVNSGPARAVKALQAILGVKADGWLGEVTMKAIRSRSVRTLIEEITDRRMSFLKGLGPEQWSEFGRGWSNRVNDIRKRAYAMAGNGVQPAAPIVPPEGTAKATPPVPVEKAVSTEQKVGGAIGTAALIVTPAGAIWRENKDVLTDPFFLGFGLLLALGVGFLLMRKPKPVEAQA